MNVIEVVHALVSMAPMEREMVLDIVSKANRRAFPEANRSKAIDRTPPSKSRYDVYERRHLDKLFRDAAAQENIDLYGFLSTVAGETHRTLGAIERKWREFLANKVEDKTWEQWVRGKK
jgi:hypothetical protein